MTERTFLAELKRRNVYRVAVAYAVVAWVLIQLGSILFPTFDAPAWVMKAFVGLLVLGFPVAAILAWAYELTPDGIRRADEVPPQQSVVRSTGRKLDFVIIGVLVFAVALLVFDRFRTRNAAGDTAIAKSIAVLPFANLSEDKSNAYFADGIQDEILTRLAKIGAMKVISRTSTLQFQSKPGSVTDIAKQLGVAYVLEGSVQKANDSVRVNVQLIKADHDSHLWAETYDRKLTDIFAVETEVAERIAKSLEMQLSGGERKAISSVPTRNAEAYDSYLRGVAFLNKQGFGQLVNARRAFEHAIEVDPNFAQAWARLALTEAEIYFGGAPGEGQHTAAQAERARHTAETAMRLEPNLSDSHLGLGSYYYYCLRDFDRALAEMDEAHRLAPSDAYVIFARGLIKRRQGKFDDALKLQQEAAVLDPRNSDMWVNLARTYCGLRDFARARDSYDRAIAIAPDEQDIAAEKADTYLTEGNLDAAEAIVATLTPNAISSVYSTRITLLIFRRQLDRAAELLARSVEAPETPPTFRAFDRLELGAVWLALNNPGARQAIEEARAEFAAMRQQGDTATEKIAAFIRASALLGDRAAVERESEPLLRENAHDHWHLPRLRVQLARSYAFLHDADRAIALLAAACAAPGDTTPTPNNLRIDPAWDNIRNDPRFQQLCGDRKP